MRTTLSWLALALPVACGCSMLPCSHPHDAVCDEIEDRSLTSLVGYCPCLDVNHIGRQPWFQPSSCLATDARQKRLVRRPPPEIPRIEPPPKTERR